MMNTIKDGGPAFPRPGSNWKGADGQPMGCDACLGMTMRDHFAGLALQGMLACEMLRATEQEFSERAYKVADAMLKAREVTA